MHQPFNARRHYNVVRLQRTASIVHTDAIPSGNWMIFARSAKVASDASVTSISLMACSRSIVCRMRCGASDLQQETTVIKQALQDIMLASHEQK